MAPAGCRNQPVSTWPRVGKAAASVASTRATWRRAVDESGSTRTRPTATGRHPRRSFTTVAARRYFTSIGRIVPSTVTRLLLTSTTSAT